MGKTEFEVINKYFSFPANGNDVELSVGDDCAVVSLSGIHHQKLLITTDTLVSGVHFPVETSPRDIAYKSLMVNLSDLAAMGATPKWVTLSITLPEIDEAWLSAFSEEFNSVLAEHKVSLIGGDTTRGALSITIQAMGSCENRVMRRNQARPGNLIYVTGKLGDAAIGLTAILKHIDDKKLQPCIDRLNRPVTRVQFARALSEYSSCAIDISDGLLADLQHVLTASKVGAVIRLPEIPLSDAAHFYFKHYLNDQLDWPLILAGGDDFELCFTISDTHQEAVHSLAESHDVALSCIGRITQDEELVILDESGQSLQFEHTGYQHF